MDSQPTFQPSPNGLRILYIAPMNYGWYGLYRQHSLERLGHTVFPVDIMQYETHGNPWMARIRYRLQIGSVVTQMNDGCAAAGERTSRRCGMVRQAAVYSR